MSCPPAPGHDLTASPPSPSSGVHGRNGPPPPEGGRSPRPSRFVVYAPATRRCAVPTPRRRRRTYDGTAGPEPAPCGQGGARHQRRAVTAGRQQRRVVTIRPAPAPRRHGRSARAPRPEGGSSLRRAGLAGCEPGSLAGCPCPTPTPVPDCPYPTGHARGPMLTRFPSTTCDSVPDRRPMIRRPGPSPLTSTSAAAYMVTSAAA